MLHRKSGLLLTHLQGQCQQHPMQVMLQCGGQMFPCRVAEVHNYVPDMISYKRARNTVTKLQTLKPNSTKDGH